jgi:aspartate oxidase
MTVEPGSPGEPPARPEVSGPAFPGARPATQPPRPELTGEAFTATGRPVTPGSVSAAVSVWVASLASGLLAAGSVVRAQPHLRDQFAAEVLERDATVSAATAQHAASVLVWVVVGGLALAWLVHLLLVVRTAGGHNAARWVLVVLGLLGAALLVVLQDVIAAPGTTLFHDLTRLALLAQATCAVVGSVLLLAPSASRYFKAVRLAR